MKSRVMAAIEGNANTEILETLSLAKMSFAVPV